NAFLHYNTYLVIKVIYIYYNVLLKGGTQLMTMNIVILIPFIAAILLLLFCRNFTKFHICWIVLIIPATLFVFLLRQLPYIANGVTFTDSINWIPTYDMNFVTHLDGLSMIFGLLITGIGTLVVIYSIYYL